MPAKPQKSDLMKKSTKDQKIEHKLSQIHRQLENIEKFCNQDSKTAVELSKGIINDIRKVLVNEPDGYYFTKDNRYMFYVSDMILKVKVSDNIQLHPSVESMLQQIADSRDIHPEALIPEIIRIELDSFNNLLVNKKPFEHNGNDSLINAILKN